MDIYIFHFLKNYGHYMLSIFFKIYRQLNKTIDKSSFLKTFKKFNLTFLFFQKYGIIELERIFL